MNLCQATGHSITNVWKLIRALISNEWCSRFYFCDYMAVKDYFELLSTADCAIVLQLRQFWMWPEKQRVINY